MILAALVAVGAPRTARAEPPTPPASPAPPPQETQTYWYGWQIVFLDLLSFGVILSSASDRTGPSPYLGVASYVVVPSIVHDLHGRPLAGVASIGLRLALPALGGLIGNATQKGDAGWGGLAAFVMGVFVGGLTATVIDVAALSTETRPVPPKVSWSPSVSPVRGGAVGGVGVRF